MRIFRSRWFRRLLLASLPAAFILYLPFLWTRWVVSRTWNQKPEDLRDSLASAQDRQFLCLILAVDGVPYDVIRDLKAEGRFKSFLDPGRMVSTFPSLTRPSFAKMLRGGLPYGYERLYYDWTERRVKGFSLAEKVLIAPKEHKDYHPTLDFLGFPGYIAYAFPQSFTDAAFKAFKRRILAYPGDQFVAYMGLTDPIAHVKGEEPLKAFLRDFDSMIEAIQKELPFPVKVVMFSDHGNNLRPNARVDLFSPLAAGGFRSADSLKSPEDFVLPENGLVGAAVLYTEPKNAGPMCRILAAVPGVDLCVFREQDRVRVLGEKGEALIEKSLDRYRYQSREGDPLLLSTALDRLRSRGLLDENGFARDTDWWEQTKDHEYPDPLHRIWDGLTTLVEHPATILVSFKEGYACGPRIFDKAVAGRSGTHGGLIRSHTYGFFMTDFMQSPEFVRPEMVAEFLEKARQEKTAFLAGRPDIPAAMTSAVSQSPEEAP